MAVGDTSEAWGGVEELFRHGFAAVGLAEAADDGAGDESGGMPPFFWCVFPVCVILSPPSWF